MKIKRLVIENFKSIERIELIEPNPFTVFVGPNGSGKLNIFEALEFWNISHHVDDHVNDLFGGDEALLNRTLKDPSFLLMLDFDSFYFEESGYFSNPPQALLDPRRRFDFDKVPRYDEQTYNQFYRGFTRLFVGNQKIVKLSYNGDKRLSLSAQNLEKVLKRLLSNHLLKEEIFEWLDLFIPGFKSVEVDDRNELHWFEDSSDKYFTKDLISDGTYSILALLTAVYQSDDEPQFLCIEEPENGLHPKVARELMDFFRFMCEERGHYIWVNTHSPYMASRVKPEELVTVNKVKQFKGMDWYGLTADEAWLSNVLGGGNPW